MGWVLRVFQSRKRSLMLTLLKSLVIPLLEYCCQLSNPWKAKDIQAIEAIHRTFTYKITEVLHLNYWERLHELKLYSLQRRLERYIIIYIWKITQHMVPNIDGTMGHKIKTRKHPRHGTQCVIQYPTNRNPAQPLQENAITVYLGLCWTTHCPNICETSKVSKLKNWNLSSTNFWNSFLMCEKCPTMSPHQEATASSTSSLIWGLKEFTKVVESPTLLWSSLSCFKTTPSIHVPLSYIFYIHRKKSLLSFTDRQLTLHSLWGRWSPHRFPWRRCVGDEPRCQRCGDVVGGEQGTGLFCPTLPARLSAYRVFLCLGAFIVVIVIRQRI